MPQSAFADLIPGQPAAQPGLVPLTAPKPPDPFKVRDQQLQEEAAARAREDQQFQRQKFEREMARADKPPKDPKVTEGERAGAGFYRRAMNAHRLYGEGVLPRNPVAQGLIDILPESWENAYFDEPTRRAAKNYADEFIRAKLRKESGAAISVPEMETEYKVYFPVPGDKKADLERKALLREQALEGLRLAAGSEADAALEGLTDDQRGGEGAGDIGFNTPDQPTNPFTPEQQRAYDAFLTGNPQATAAQLIAFTNKLGAGDLDPQRAREIIDVYRKTGEFAPGETARRVLDAQQQAEVAEAREKAGALTAGVMGASDTVTLGTADEAAAGIDAFLDAMRGEGSFTDNYERSLETSRAIRDVVSEDNPVSYIAGQVAGGFALPIGGATSAARLAGIGAAYGGAYGAGSSDGSITDRLVGFGVGAGVGATAAGSFGLIGNHLAARGAGRVDPRRADARSLIEAAGRQNIDVLPADVGGGRIGDLVRRATGGLGQGFVAGPRIQEAAEATTRGFQARVGELAAEEGAAQGRGAVGATVLDALEGFNARTQLEGSDIYANARRMAAGQEFQGQKAVETLDQHIAELAQNENTNKPLIDGLNRLRSDLASGADLKTKGVDAMRNLRTSVRAEAGTEGLRGTDYKRRANEVLDSLSEDIASQLPKEAADEFQKGDALWRDRLNFIDDVEERLLGPKGDRSAEKVMRSLIEMSRSDTRRFRLLLNQVTPEEAGIIRSSFIQDMGRAAPGNPESFSIEAWAKNFRTLRDQSGGSLDLLFRGASREHANDLLTIAQGVERAGNARNFSNTGSAINATTVLQMLGLGAGGGVGGFVGAAAGLGTAAAIEAALGKALTSPNFARWLARPPKERGRALKRLSRIAAREPALAAEIVPIQNALQRAIPQAAAEQDEQQ